MLETEPFPLLPVTTMQGVTDFAKAGIWSVPGVVFWRPLQHNPDVRQLADKRHRQSLPLLTRSDFMKLQ